MAVLRVLSRQGDVETRWDPQRLEQADAEAIAAVREAERIFAEQLARGATAFKVQPGRPAERQEVFDPQAEEIIVVPRIAGG